MSNTASLKKEYQDRIVPALTKEVRLQIRDAGTCFEENRD